MTLYSTFSDYFLDTVATWIGHGNVFVVIYWSAAGGMRSHGEYSDFQIFFKELAKLPPQTEVDVFRGEQFSLNGYVDSEFITFALAYFPDKTALMVAETCDVPNSVIYIEECANHQELQKCLDELVGVCVSVGNYPTWHLDDHENKISGLVPAIDGTMKKGIY